MKKIYVVAIAVALVVLGAVIGCMCCCCHSKTAVVDVMAIVNQSAQVTALKEEQTTKTQELAQWLQDAQNEVKAEKDTKKQEELLKKYNDEFVQKREEMAKQYGEELQKIDASISAAIAETAKKKGYKMVVAKGMVLFGGDDITEEIAEIVK